MPWGKYRQTNHGTSFAIQVDDLTPSDAEDVDKLAQELSHFPLAISQAGAFISETLSTPRKYLHTLRVRREKLLNKQEQMKNPDKYEYPSVHTAWLISYEKLNSRAKQLLSLCSFLHFDDIQQTGFEHLCRGLDKYEMAYADLLLEEERVAISDLKGFCDDLLVDG
jgi:hypothetical protein